MVLSIKKAILFRRLRAKKPHRRPNRRLVCRCDARLYNAAPMKKLLSLTSVLLLLSACTGRPPQGMSLEERLKNHLFAEAYYDTLLDRMVELDIQDDPLLEDSGKASIVENTRRDALAKAKEATRKQREGLVGSFVPAKEQAGGEG